VEIEDFLAEFRSPSTKNTYKIALKRFFEFKNTIPKKYFTKKKKISEYTHDLKIFVRYLEDKKMTPKSITTYLGGTISYFSKNDIELPRRFWSEIKVGSYAVTNDGVLSKVMLFFCIYQENNSFFII
jgi:hypothetical protein